jgi:hypothetical protein
MHFVACFIDTVNIVRINNKDQSRCIVEIVPPKSPDMILTTDISNIHVEAILFDGFDIESDGRDSCSRLIQLQFVEYGCLSGRIELQHQERVS